MPRINKLFNLNDPGWGRGNNNNNGSEPPRRPQGNGDGPPDLDEVWRDFNNRIGSLFGRKGGGGNNRPNNRGGATPPSPRNARIGLGVIALVGVGIWLASGFYIVQEGQVAVVTQFGKYKSTSQAGFQWRLPYPIQSHEIVNVSQLRATDNAVSQLNTQMNYQGAQIGALQNQIGDVARIAYSGTAMAFAMAGTYLPTLYPGEKTVGVGIGNYKGYSAVGLTFKALSNDGKMSWGAGISTTGKEWGINAGIGWKWR